LRRHGYHSQQQISFLSLHSFSFLPCNFFPEFFLKRLPNNPNTYFQSFIMYISNSLALFALAASSQAISFPSVSKLFRRDACPAVWTQISSDLTAYFLTGAECNDNARAAIRAVFHDCFPGQGCDGSLSLPEELARLTNQPMAATVTHLKSMAEQYNVTVADMIAFAGCKLSNRHASQLLLIIYEAHGVVTCPQGPVVTTYIGREDSGVAAPDGQLPPANVTGDDALQHFSAKGFTAQDLAALIGAHTASRQFITDPTEVGVSQDTTPGIWDIVYFVQTLLKQAPLSFPSDISLSQQESVGPYMKQFSTDKASWDAAFTAA
jgi:hypothetical protein